GSERKPVAKTESDLSETVFGFKDATQGSEVVFGECGLESPADGMEECRLARRWQRLVVLDLVDGPQSEIGGGNGNAEIAGQVRDRNEESAARRLEKFSCVRPARHQPLDPRKLVHVTSSGRRGTPFFANEAQWLLTWGHSAGVKEEVEDL